ncbi:type II toxin-antitoxin system HipA family toxin [Gluconobacter oxydans]|uniref:type II toxin-antitoxin system HipA family toxin n=1 Tax=Gluconobacter oxydans TaxID=442 RepID=UPI00209E88E9|nr:HipA domain-containing protein [Gluconobacter oxydans]MCP1249863.1 HipA domain-containing protein [Gluconobacter oxydans]
MALYLVGETIDRTKAHASAQAGDLVSPWRGIYINATDDVDRTVLAHAVRIAAYLYPRAYLSASSAASLAPTVDGRLFLSGRRNQRTRIRALEIIQNEAPEQPSTIPVIVGDDLGEIHLTASSPRQRFLEAFRLRSEHAGAIDPTLRRQMADRLIEEYRDRASAADALWALGRANRWIREAEAAEQYLLNDAVFAAPPVNRAGVSLVAAWHGEVVGNLTHDGAEWRWQPTSGNIPGLVRETRPGSLPPFIESLLPEGWLAKVLNERDERETLRSGSRYMSNMIIVPDERQIAALPPDVIDGRLAHFHEGGMFTGRYQGPTRQIFEDSFQEKLAGLFTAGSTPRLSGVQIKLPMYLRQDGGLLPATETPFTHILKPAGTNGFENLPLVEWICLNLARSAQFEVPEVALVGMPDGMAPALLVERFDIRRSSNNTDKLVLEDFCSVLDLPAARKYEGTIEKMARGMRSLSTNPLADNEILFSRAVFAWLIADGDMHLKNLALLKIAEAGTASFASVRFAPVYDVVTTRVFPGLENDRMALKLNGKDDRLTPDDFLALARTIEIPQAHASVLMATCARRLVNAMPSLVLPAVVSSAGERLFDRIRQIIGERVDPFL